MNAKEQAPVAIDNKAFYGTLLRLALPIALQSLIGASLHLVDNIMVGRLGEVEVAAVGVGIQPFNFYWMVIFGFAGGIAAFVSQFFGAEDIKNIRKTVGFAIFISSGIGVLLFIATRFYPEYVVNIFTNNLEIKPQAIEYMRICSFSLLFESVVLPVTFCLRAIQQPRLPLITSTIAFCTSTFLNYVLIFGNFGAPRLEIAGAALATVIARALEMLLILFIIFYKKNALAGKLREYIGWTREFARRVLSIAVPAMLNETLWAAGTAMYIVAYARLSTAEFAAVQISHMIENLFIYAAFAVGDAALILLGQRLGAGELEYGWALSVKLLKTGTVIGFILGAMLIAASQPIISFYNISPEAQKNVFYILIIFGATMALVLFNVIIVVGILRAGGDTKFALIADCSSVWLFGVPAVFITTQLLHLPVYWCVFWVTMEQVVKFFMLSKRFMSKKWLKNVIYDL